MTALADPSAPAFVEALDISKTYGAVKALRGIDLKVQAGTVHALLGANGAGKSTLVRILAGAEHQDGGQLVIGGEEFGTSLTPLAARRLGLRFIHQDPQLVPKLSGLQNMMLREPIPRRAGLISWRRARQRVTEAARRAGVDFDLDIPVERLSLTQQWLLAVARTLVGNARLVAMDEPTASLPAAASAQVYRVVRELAAQGVAVLYITHRLEEVVDLADEVTVIRDGRRSALLSRGQFDVDGLVRAIVGSELEPRATGSSVLRAEPLIEVHSLRRAPIVRDVSFTIHRGEILGLGGLVGAGRTEVARLLFGADRPDAGEMTLEHGPYAPHSTHDAIAHGVALVPEERRSQGLLLQASIADNVALPSWRSFRNRATRFLSMKDVADEGRRVVERFHVRALSVKSPVRTLSGGNQQKVLLGRWLRLDLKVLILDEPTRGVDVGARAEIHRIARAFANGGHGVLMISSELEELAVCDRVVVLREGRVAGEVLAPNISEATILTLCYPDNKGA